jgi:hypothetical protein
MVIALLHLAYDPDKVKPGWIALVIVAALGLATFLLWRSMNTQLGKIRVPKRGETEPDESDSSEGEEPTS